MSGYFSLERLSNLKRKAAWAIGAALVLWVLFFDSHSVYSRIQMHREYARIEADNARLKARITALEEKLSRPLSDEEVERIAREQFGMSKAGERVYPVVESN